jgi:hypothetical protein
MMDAGEDFLLRGLPNGLGVGRGGHRAETRRAQDQDKGGALEVHDFGSLSGSACAPAEGAAAKPAQAATRALNRF